MGFWGFGGCRRFLLFTEEKEGKGSIGTEEKRGVRKPLDEDPFTEKTENLSIVDGEGTDKDEEQ